MRKNVVRTIESLLFIGLLMPVGMLFGISTFQPPAVTSRTANWADSEEASNLLNEMQTLGLKVRRQAARLQAQEGQLYWQDQSDRLASARTDIDTIGRDLGRLDQIKGRLEPWQQSLVNKVTPHVHEMVYQADAALNELNTHRNRTVLALTQYPQNINILYKSANKMVGTIGTVTQYAHAEQKMAALAQHAPKSRS